MAPLATLKASATAVQLLAKLASRKTEQFERLRDEMFREWLAEFQAATAAVISDLEHRTANLESALEEMVQDDQLLRLINILGYEAMREAIRERQAMLAFAAAGLLDPRLTVEEKARVERTLRQLDPADVRALHGLSLIVGCEDPGDPARRSCISQHELFAKIVDRIPAGDVLVAAGCVRIRACGGAAVDTNEGFLTGAGTNLLQVLRVYVRDRGPNFDVPGREYRPGDRPVADAKRVLASASGLLPFLQTAQRHPAMRFKPIYYRPHPTKDEPGRIELHFLASARPELEAVARTVEGTELAIELRDMPYQASADVIVPHVALVVAGAHDVLRVAADEADARWVSA